MKAHARNTDPITSHLAADSVDLTAGQEEVMRVFAYYSGGLSRPVSITDEELVDIALLSPSGARSRRSELVAMGLLVDTGGKVRGDSGRWMIKWGLASWVWLYGIAQHPIIEGGDQMALPL